MGGTQSKDEGAGKHVFESSAPISFSQELIDSLQASAETNSTRAKSLDLHIQQRVAAELKKIQDQETSTLEKIRSKIASGEKDSKSSSSSSDSKDTSSSDTPSLLDLTSISAKDLLPTSKATKEEEARKAQSSKKVQEEIQKLKEALGQRKKISEVPKGVEDARQTVIACLRMNDRRPLDCWKEVEIFKREVRKLEDKFVSDVL